MAPPSFKKTSARIEHECEKAQRKLRKVWTTSPRDRAIAHKAAERLGLWHATFEHSKVMVPNLLETAKARIRMWRNMKQKFPDDDGFQQHIEAIQNDPDNYKLVPQTYVCVGPKAAMLELLAVVLARKSLCNVVFNYIV